MKILHFAPSARPATSSRQTAPAAFTSRPALARGAAAHYLDVHGSFPLEVG